MIKIKKKENNSSNILNFLSFHNNINNHSIDLNCKNNLKSMNASVDLNNRLSFEIENKYHNFIKKNKSKFSVGSSADFDTKTTCEKVKPTYNKIIWIKPNDRLIIKSNIISNKHSRNISNKY